MNVKKFAQDKAKKMKYEKFMKQNKENLYSVDDSKFKQFSVDLHKLSMDQEYPNRNIIKEEISVFLQNQSQNKTFNDKNLLQIQLRKFTKKLDENDGSIKQFLDSELQDMDQIRADQIRKLIGVLVRKLDKGSSRNSLSKQQSTSLSSKTSVKSKYQSKDLLSQEKLAPYLKQQLQMMEKKLHHLEQENSQYKEFKNIQKSQKQYIRHTLETVYKRQLEEVYELEQLCNIV